jgi:uncharacterized protein (DUF2237 family)
MVNGFFWSFVRRLQEGWGEVFESFDAGMAPKIRLESTHASTLEFANIEDLKACAAQ